MSRSPIELVSPTSLLLALLAALICIGCEREEPTRSHQFVIPAGFRGIIRISEDPAGTPVRATGDVTIMVPTDGVVKLRSTKSLYKLGRVAATSIDGSSIPKGIGGEPPDTVRFFSLFSDSEGTNYYLVGTSDEWSRLQKEGLPD